MSDSTIARRIAAMKDFKAAAKAAQQVLDTLDDDDPEREEIEEVLENHKDNPSRQSRAQATGEVDSEGPSAEADPARPAKVGRVWEERIGGITKEEIERRLENEEIDFGEALELAKSSEGFTLFCSAKSGWISISGKGRFPANMHPEMLQRVLDSSDAIRAILAKHAAATKQALENAKK
jgi:hypothetical protein